MPPSIPNPQGSDRDHNYESTDAGPKSEIERKRGLRKNGKRKGKDKPVLGKSSQASLERFTRQTKDGCAAEGIGIAYLPRETASVEEEAHNLDEDPNPDRRKRRKTTPPTLEPACLPHALCESDTKDPITASSVPSWHEQLQFEATKGSCEVLAEASSPRSVLQDSSGLLGVIPDTPPMNRQNEAMVMQLPYPPLAVNCPLPVESQSDNVKDANLNNKTTSESTMSQKKLLVLDSNGRFSSPVSKTHRGQCDESTKRTKSKKKSNKGLISGIVIIKYGSDTENRSYVGNQIERIIAGAARKENSKMKMSKGSSKSGDPLKPTHPFFLGKPNQRKEELTPPITASESSHVSKLLKKSTVTPGKLRAQAQSMHSVGTSLPFGSVVGDSKLLKHPGMSEAPWPWKGMAHIRNFNDIEKNRAQLASSIWLYADRFQKMRKLKRNVITVPAHEDLIGKITYQLKPFLSVKVNEDHYPQGITTFLRFPTRLLTTGVTLQHMVEKEIRARFQKFNSHSPDVLGGEISQPQNNIHPALNGLFRDIENSLTPFDKGECETQMWSQKYAPICAADVLQPGKEAIVIRDWLKNLSVITVDSGKDLGKAKDRLGTKQKPVKKKRKKTGELDDFIVASDEDDEDDEMDELTDPEDLAPAESRHAFKKSLVRMSDQTNMNGARLTRR